MRKNDEKEFELPDLKFRKIIKLGERSFLKLYNQKNPIHTVDEESAASITDNLVFTKKIDGMSNYQQNFFCRQLQKYKDEDIPDEMLYLLGQIKDPKRKVRVQLDI